VSFGADGPRTEVSIDRIQFGGPDASPYVVPKFHNLPRSANRPGGRRTSSPRSPPRSSAVGVAASEPRFSMWHFLLTLCATCCALIPSTRADPQLPVPVSFRPSDRVELNFVPLVQAMYTYQLNMLNSRNIFILHNKISLDLNAKNAAPSDYAGECISRPSGRNVFLLAGPGSRPGTRYVCMHPNASTAMQ